MEPAALTCYETDFLSTDTNHVLENASVTLVTFENDCTTSFANGFELVYYSLDHAGKIQSIPFRIMHSVPKKLISFHFEEFESAAVWKKLNFDPKC